MSKRVLFAMVIALVLVPMVAPAAAQEATPTPTPENRSGVSETPTADRDRDSQFTLEELREGGTRSAGAPPSMRFLGKFGSATLRHNPVGVGSDEWSYIKPNTVVKRNSITLRTIRLGDPDESLTVHVVAWNKGTREVASGNGTVERPAALNVTHREVEAKLGRGYDSANVSLPPSFGESQQITMWVEQHPEARWNFQHRSIATTRSIDISSWGDFLSALFWKIGLFAGPAMMIGWWLGKNHREKAIVGPQWGAIKWGLAFAAPIAALGSLWAFQGAVIATRVPQAIGLLFAPATYALVVEAGDHSLESYLFRHQDLEAATSPRGEETVDSRYVTHITKKGVRRQAEGEIVLIEEGIMPYIARLRGELAVLDITEVQTQKKGRGPYALEIELDPAHETYGALMHEPPRVRRRSLMKAAEVPGIGSVDVPNPAVIGPIGIGVGAGWFIAGATLGVPGVGAVAGFVLAQPFIHQIEEGGAEAEPAPFHFTQAEASLAKEQEEYADARSIEQWESIAWESRMEAPLDARDIIQRFGGTVTQKLNEAETGLEDDLDPNRKTRQQEVAESDD